MNFTREQVAKLRRLLELTTDLMNEADHADVERLADVLDGQLDIDAGIDLLTYSDAQLDEMERHFQRSLMPF